MGEISPSGERRVGEDDLKGDLFPLPPRDDRGDTLLEALLDASANELSKLARIGLHVSFNMDTSMLSSKPLEEEEEEM